MKSVLRLEDIARFILAYTLSLYLGYSWWLFFALLLAPDLSMIGYLFGTKAGAWLYNIFHHQGLAIAVGLAGLYFGVAWLQLAGLILYGHSAMDRALEYGLKYTDSFKHTHLGWIGKQSG
ncbi:multisubunit Na+/H+ antiporter MnhB subunit [Pontibacter aydingkolensis]|uniref:DUF4260 domain-containing protein n=1 Tax=Pontibacter aydingkolensis TaxID=1911536 RepID=A0ABS7CUL0_9BACT|nr:DUF4260 domain-containing protein [Pontibacter aydingkolensis]MBW7467530.1 DUF4260 domain-containing protein [Pontibacter aydingkolensis]